MRQLNSEAAKSVRPRSQPYLYSLGCPLRLRRPFLLSFLTSSCQTLDFSRLPLALGQSLSQFNDAKDDAENDAITDRNSNDVNCEFLALLFRVQE